MHDFPNRMIEVSAKRDEQNYAKEFFQHNCEASHNRKNRNTRKPDGLDQIGKPV